MKKIVVLILLIVIIVILLTGIIIAYLLKEGGNKTGGKVETSDLVRVFSPAKNQTVKSPLTVTGEARGIWYFEAQFPVKIFDDKGNLLAQAPAQAKGDWMTENFVPFETTLEFQAPQSNKGFLVLEKDNPSGLPSNSAEIRIPIIFGQSQAVSLYYYNSKQDKNNSCSQNAVLPLQRRIFVSGTPIQDVINLLLKGELTWQEKSQGFSTEFPLEGLKLKGANLKNGTLTLQFEDPLSKTSGGSCRASILWAQVSKTAKQFTGVVEVKFSPEFLFQP